MNENPGEMPNPLKPTPAETPATNTGATQAPTSAPVTPEVANSTGAAPVSDPMARPMEQAATEPVAPKKSKTGLIVGIIIALVVLIGAGIAAALMMPRNSEDAVAEAMDKLMSGSIPDNAAIDGSIDILMHDETLPISRVNINFESDIVTGSTINTSSAVLTVTSKQNKDFSVKFAEVYATDGDLYFKLDGVKDLLEDDDFIKLLTGGGSSSLVTDCEDEDCLETETISESEIKTIKNTYGGIVKGIDGVWLRISTEELASLSENFNTENSTISCMTDLVSNVNKNSNSTAELYRKYPFVSSTTEGVLIPSKGNPVYIVRIDSENFANFVNSVQNTGLTDDLYECLDIEENVTLDGEELAEKLNKLPTLYTEVNGNKEFTRLYLESDVYEDKASVTIDLGFSYPTNVNISEPVEYTDFSKMIQEIMTNMYSLPEDND
ncbi:hypothetical protein IKG33_00355 [Candidatus Saccharibacteria bacterium]|nr:hypothetical protein [Candidatus Saccharibacteria bacterium]